MVNQILVREVMHLGVITCRVDTSLCEIARMMIDNNVHSIVVLDEAGEVCGVISDLILMKAYSKDIVNMKAEDIVKGCTVTISPNATLDEAVKVMTDKKIYHLVILSEPPFRRPIGILAASDVVRELAKVCPR